MGKQVEAARKTGKNQKLFAGGFKTGKKGSPEEGGTHVPAFWRWKGVLGEGVDINGLTAHVDIYNTFCDLAGAELPAGIQNIDGRTMLPLLENPTANWPDRELFIHSGRWGKDEDPKRVEV